MLDWNDGLAAQVAAASRRAIDQTMADAVTHAKTNHPWKNRTATLEGSLQMRPAAVMGRSVVGQWGSFTVNYALWLEIGTADMPAYPYLRPAADATYHLLAGRIRANLKGIG